MSAPQPSSARASQSSPTGRGAAPARMPAWRPFTIALAGFLVALVPSAVLISQRVWYVLPAVRWRGTLHPAGTGSLPLRGLLPLLSLASLLALPVALLLGVIVCGAAFNAISERTRRSAWALVGLAGLLIATLTLSYPGLRVASDDSGPAVTSPTAVLVTSMLWLAAVASLLLLAFGGIAAMAVRKLD